MGEPSIWLVPPFGPALQRVGKRLVGGAGDGAPAEARAGC